MNYTLRVYKHLKLSSVEDTVYIREKLLPALPSQYLAGHLYRSSAVFLMAAVNPSSLVSECFWEERNCSVNPAFPYLH